VPLVLEGRDGVAEEVHVGRVKDVDEYFHLDLFRSPESKRP